MSTRPSDNRPSVEAVVAFLREHHGTAATDIEVLGGGFWSAAFAYRVGDDELVLRINDAPDGFRDDQRAMRDASAALPVHGRPRLTRRTARWYGFSQPVRDSVTA